MPEAGTGPEHSLSVVCTVHCARWVRRLIEDIPVEGSIFLYSTNEVLQNHAKYHRSILSLQQGFEVRTFC